MEAAREGAIIVVADLASKDHGETIAEKKTLGAKCMFVPIDVSDVQSVKMAILTTVAEFGRLDVAFNNAGIGGVNSGANRATHHADNGKYGALKMGAGTNGEDYLLVNIPEFKLHVFENNKQVWSSNVVVGKAV